MSAQIGIIGDSPERPNGGHAAGTDGYRAALDELVDMGIDIARRLHRRITAEPPAAEPPAAEPPAAEPPAAGRSPGDHLADATPDLEPLAAAFDRVARTVRRCILLARSLDRPPPADPAIAAARQRVAVRTRIIREVEDAIERTESGSRAETLHVELHERLDAPDLEHELLARPVADIIADIEHDLALAAAPGTRPWKRRTPDDVAALHARAATPPKSAKHDALPANPDPPVHVAKKPRPVTDRAPFTPPGWPAPPPPRTAPARPPPPARARCSPPRYDSARPYTE